jgi:hypothetical protein
MAMVNAYQLILQCPNGHSITLQRKCSKRSLSEAQAMELVGRDEISCQSPKCSWHGTASKVKLLQILPFHWISFSGGKPAEQPG